MEEGRRNRGREGKMERWRKKEKETCERERKRRDEGSEGKMEEEIERRKPVREKGKEG